MKKILFLFSLVLLFACCSNKPKANITSPTAQISFDSTTYSFGNVPLGEKHTHTFTFHNTGNTPLIIRDVTTGCDCTTIEFDKAPVRPGNEGKITVTYDDMDRSGFFDKSATVISNSNTGEIILHFKGTVIRHSN